MTAELLATITEVPVDEVQIGRRLRPVSPAGVAALVASIGELGIMKDAIHVRREKSGKLSLMAGAHRLTAARELGWQVVPARVWRCTADWAALMEIDDNLASAELTMLDTAVFLAERKKVYEKMHPEARAAIGADLVAKRWNTAELSSVVSFADTTAEKFGISARQVRKIVAAGEALDHDCVRWLRAAPRPVNLSDLQSLSKIEDAHERAQVCIALSNGAARSAAAALAERRTDAGPAPVKDPIEAALKALREAWNRAPKATRRRFAEIEREELSALLSEAPNRMAAQ